ncbi:TPA: mgtA regulatory leader peptide MgtL [Klebsiella pneumoniae]
MDPDPTPHPRWSNLSFRKACLTLLYRKA